VQQMRKKTLLSPSPVAGKTREQVTIRWNSQKRPITNAAMVLF
jgi:hypothetical protein